VKSAANMAATRVLDAAAGLFPGYFAIVMATGALSIAMHLHGHERIARWLGMFAAVCYAVLWTLTLIRIARYPRLLVADMRDHARGPGFFTLIAATAVLGSQLIVVQGADHAAHLLWLLAVGLWGVVMYWFFVAVTIRPEKPELGSGINGAWLLVSVSTQAIAVITALLPWEAPHSALAELFALGMYLLGSMLYLAIIPLIFYRLTFLNVSGAEMAPPYWINMGAVAIATLAGSTLLLQTHSPLLEELRPFIKGMTLLFWAAASWWIPLLTALTVWRHSAAGQPLRYEPQLWGLVFPLAMYTTGSFRLAEALDIEALKAIPAVTLWVAALAWTFTAITMVRHLLALAGPEHPTTEEPRSP